MNQDPKRNTSAAVIQQATGLPAPVANCLSDVLTDSEVETLAVPSPPPADDPVKVIAADVLERLAESIRPAG